MTGQVASPARSSQISKFGFSDARDENGSKFQDQESVSTISPPIPTNHSLDGLGGLIMSESASRFHVMGHRLSVLNMGACEPYCGIGNMPTKMRESGPPLTSTLALATRLAKSPADNRRGRN